MTSFPALWAIVFLVRLIGAVVFWALAWVCEKHGKPASPWDKFTGIFINTEVILAHDFAGGFGPSMLPWGVLFVGATSALLALAAYGMCRWLGLP